MLGLVEGARFAVVVRALAVGSPISLGLPWFSGSSDGDEIVLVGADTSDWGFTVGMFALALTIAAAAARPRVVVLLGIGLALIALTSLATATRAQRSSGTRQD